MTMFEINERIREVFESLETDEDGCISDEAMQTIADLNEAKETKIESMALMVKEWLAEAEAVKAESKKLADRAKATEAKAGRLKEYLSRCLLEDGQEKFSTARCKISFRASEQVITDENWENIDPRYVIHKETFTPDKVSIKEAIKSGIEVKGAHLETKKNIQIK